MKGTKQRYRQKICDDSRRNAKVYYTSVRRLLLLLTATLLLLGGCQRGPRPALVNSPAPDFSLRDSERAVSLRDLRGQVVVLNFWATWCPPCVEEMPSLVAMQQRMKGRVTVLAVSVDLNEEAYKRFLRDYKIDLMTVRDPDGREWKLQAPK